jgi:hypothetical protein
VRGGDDNIWSMSHDKERLIKTLREGWRSWRQDKTYTQSLLIFRPETTKLTSSWSRAFRYMWSTIPSCPVPLYLTKTGRDHRKLKERTTSVFSFKMNRILESTYVSSLVVWMRIRVESYPILFLSKRGSALIKESRKFLLKASSVMTETQVKSGAT